MSEATPPAAPAASPAGHAAAPVHVTPVWLLLAVWAALVLLTVLTAAAMQIDLGALNVWVAMAIATFKALLVLLFFMHLIHDRPFNSFIVLTALVFVTLFIGITMMDTAEYDKDRIPDYAPRMQR